jgi:hypothetical protein
MNDDRSDRVAEEAYRIWEKEGKPHGKSLDHWLEAEAGVAGTNTEDAPPIAGRKTRERPAAPQEPASAPASAKAPPKAKPGRTARGNGHVTQ